jgi:hypothetical protein
VFQQPPRRGVEQRRRPVARCPRQIVDPPRQLRLSLTEGAVAARRRGASMISAFSKRVVRRTKYGFTADGSATSSWVATGAADQFAGPLFAPGVSVFVLALKGPPARSALLLSD